MEKVHLDTFRLIPALGDQSPDPFTFHSSLIIYHLSINHIFASTLAKVFLLTDSETSHTHTPNQLGKKEITKQTLSCPPKKTEFEFLAKISRHQKTRQKAAGRRALSGDSLKSVAQSLFVRFISFPKPALAWREGWGGQVPSVRPSVRSPNATVTTLHTISPNTNTNSVYT